MFELQFLCLLLCAPVTGSIASPNETSECLMKDGKPGNKANLVEQSMTLEEETDNQENILSKLLGDYDKVKALSEGSDCSCKCIVRPLSRSACRHTEEGGDQAQHFYTVETVTLGKDCKCACIAPPSALNPCEGDFRLKKLRDAGENGIKFSTVLELLEGAFYGMDLLKLHSVTAKLLKRVENVEKAVSQNHAKGTEAPKTSFYEQARVKDDSSRPQVEKRMRVSNLGDTAAAFAHTGKKYEEKFVGNQGLSLHQLKKNQPESPKGHAKDRKEPQSSFQKKAASSGTAIRGITFYKSNAVEEGDTKENLVDSEAESGDGSVDLFIEDHLLEHKPPTSHARSWVRPVTNIRAATISTTTADVGKTWASHSSVSPTVIPAIPKETRSPPVLATNATPRADATDGPSSTTEALRPTTVPSAIAGITTPTKAAPTTSTPATTVPTTASTTEASALATLARMTQKPSTASESAQARRTSGPVPNKHRNSISWTEGDSKQKLKQTSEECKDTLATVADPVTHNTYGRNEGAWMKDPKAEDDKIYVTNYYYGNILLEFRNMEIFKKGRITNSYKLPYHWIGTGHAVFNGAFFYNRAFSRDIIKFDLRRRYVATWTILHNAVFESSAPWKWRGHSDIDFAVDESGLWVVYPAIDEDSFHQEVIMLSKLNPVDLSIQKEMSWRTGLRKDFYGNCFIVCGVLYAVDKYNQMNANISYAFDTHTNTQMIPRLPFINSYSYTTQIDYNPKEQALYAWDNGHQVTYNVVFAY
ncbi:olfactomedin-like 2Ba [Brienomyrus brachyistius]|uniref:olfactomedin-like 2Ba n=1 Tax=Brienomyrus brachyistius TaxID=42636 RepID=UPI0020B30456|nr:olfactomedin-like 2Ba [Brienomyrus brachyistius]